MIQKYKTKHHSSNALSIVATAQTAEDRSSARNRWMNKWINGEEVTRKRYETTWTTPYFRTCFGDVASIRCPSINLPSKLRGRFTLCLEINQTVRGTFLLLILSKGERYVGTDLDKTKKERGEMKRDIYPGF